MIATKKISDFAAVVTPAGGDLLLVKQTDNVERKATWTQLDLFVRVPDADGTKDLGSAAKRFRDLFLSRRITLSDAAGDPSAAGELQRNVASLKFHDGTAARTLALLETAQTISGAKTFSADVAVDVEDARTNTVDVPLTVESTTTGVPAPGIGTGILVRGKSADENPSDFGRLDFVATDVTAASEDTVLDVVLRVAGAVLSAAWRFTTTTAFRGIFAHANTADRTYTLPDRTVTLGGVGDAAFNYTFNGDFEIWGAGTTTIPTGWTLSGAGATVAKNTTAGQFKYTAASFALTRVGADASGFQDVDLISGFGPVGVWQSRTVTFGCWVRATVASRARLSIGDGVGTTNSSYHTGGSALEFLTVTRVIDAAATRVRISCLVDTGDTTAQFDGAILVVGNAVTDFIPSGWRGRKAIVAFHSRESGQGQGGTAFVGAYAESATEGISEYRMPFKAVARNLVMHYSANVGGTGQTAISTLRKEQADTSLTVTVSSGVASGSNVVDEVAFAQFDRFTLKSALSATTGLTIYGGTVEIEGVP